MPLSEPGGGGFSSPPNGLIITQFPLKNAGTDAAVSYQAIIYDEVSDRLVIGGDNDYIGEMAGAFSKLNQSAALPASNNTCAGLAVNENDGGILYLDGAFALFRSDQAISAWATITPPAVTTRRGVFTLAGDPNIYTLTVNLAGPNRNIEISGDNGLTWDSNPGAFAPVSNQPSFLCVSPTRNRVAIGSSTTAGVAIAVTADPTDPLAWVTFTDPIFAFGNVSAMAFSSDGNRFCATNSVGGIYMGNFQTGIGAFIPVNANPFAQNTSAGYGIRYISYIPSMAGFLLMAPTQEVAAFVSDADPTVATQGVYTADVGITQSGTGFNPLDAVDGNGNYLGIGASDRAIVLIQ